MNLRPLLIWLLAPLLAHGQIVRNAAATDLHSPTAIGDVAPNTGAFTGVSATTSGYLLLGGGGMPSSTGMGLLGGGLSPVTFQYGTAPILGLSTFSGTDFILMRSNAALTWCSTGDFTGADPIDLRLYRDALATLRLGGTAAGDNCALLIPGLYTDGSNYHLGKFQMTDTGLEISTQTAGTGVDNLDITLTTSGSGFIYLRKTDGAASSFQLQNSTTGNGPTDGLQFATLSSEGYIWNFENAGLTFATNNTSRLVIAAGGGATFSGDLAATGNTTLGTGTAIKNIRHGVSNAMSSGVVTVTDTGCTANTRYFFTVHTIGTVAIPSTYYVTTRTASTSFVVTASVLTDTSTLDWEAVEP